MCFAITYSFISHRESLSTMSCTDTTEARKTTSFLGIYKMSLLAEASVYYNEIFQTMCFIFYIVYLLFLIAESSLLHEMYLASFLAYLVVFKKVLFHWLLCFKIDNEGHYSTMVFKITVS